MMSIPIAPKLERKDPVFYLLILLVALLICAPMLWYGASNGDSIEYNLVWLKNFTAQLAQGDIYPRWLTDMNHGAGSPVFYFYAPLPFYLSALPGLIVPTIKLTVQLAIGEALLIAFSGMAFYRFARRYCAVAPAFVCAVLYMVLPYHFEIDLWLRQDLGELANYIWMPLALYYSEKLFNGEEGFVGLALVYSLMMFSHLPSALLFSIALGCYILVVMWRHSAWRYLPYFSAAIAVGILLAGIYWVPALFSEDNIRTDKLWTPYFDFHNWFLPIKESEKNVLGNLTFPHRLFAVELITTAIFAVCWLYAWWRRARTEVTALLTCLVLFAVAWFLMSSWSRVVWETVPELWKVQFPWRIAMVVDLAAAIAVMHAFNTLYVRRDKISVGVIAVALSVLLYGFGTANVWHKLDPFDNAWWVKGRDNAVKNGLDAPEYTTRWNQSKSPDTSIELANSAKLSYDDSAGEVKVLTWAPRKISLHVNLRRGAALIVRQFYFPNWRAKNGAGAVLKIDPAVNTGLIRILAPAGNYQLYLQLLPLRQELIGAVLSAIGLLLLGGRIWLHRRKRRALMRAVVA